MAAERIVNRFVRLMDVRILHHFWLDDGATSFDALTVPEQETRLLTYDVRRFLSVVPTASTERAILGLRGVFRATALGLVIAVPADTVVPDDTVFEFALSVRDADYFNYTTGTLRPQPLHTLFHEPTRRAVRFKENVPVYSNLTGSPRGSGAGRPLFLSTEFPPLSSTDAVEALVNDGGALVQLTADQPNATTLTLDAQVQHAPVYANQSDIPPIVPPAGIVGVVPTHGIQLDDDISSDIHALIRIAAVKTGDAEYSLTTGGVAKDPPPVFQIRLKNRSTVWRYFNKTMRGPPLNVAGPLALTHFGNAGAAQKPAEGIVTIEKAGAAVSGIVSEIFV